MRDWRTLSSTEKARILKEARPLVGSLPWATLARRFDLKGPVLRKQLDPDFVDRLRLNNGTAKKAWTEHLSHYHAERIDAAEIAARFAEVPLRDTRSLTARLFGDPLPTRSALDRKRHREVRA